MEKAINAMIFIMFLLIGIPSVLGSSWSAHVLDENGTAINGATVTAVLASNGTSVSSTLTDGAGFFTVSILALTSVILVSSKTGFQTGTSQALPPIAADVVLPFNITLIRALSGNITGRVTDKGQSVSNALIEAIQGGEVKGSDTTNANGRYAIPNLRDGVYTVKITTDRTTQNITNVVVLSGSVTEADITALFEEVPAPAPSGGGGGGTGGVLEEEVLEEELPAPEVEVLPKGEEIPEETQETQPPEEALPQLPAVTGAVVEEEKPSFPIPLGTGIAVLIALVTFVLYERYHGTRSGAVMHKRLYKALHQAHALIREKDFKKALHSYYGIQKKYDHLPGKRKEVKLHRDIEKLHDEVRLYLMVDELHKQTLDGDMRGLRPNMHAVITLAHKVAREAPGDKALYSYANRQYEHCRQLLKEHEERA